MCGRMLSALNFSVVHLRHSPNPPAPQPGILIAVSPAVNCPLNEASFRSKAWVQFSQRPSNRIAFSFINQSITPVLIFRAACSRVDAVLGLEVLAESINIHRLNVASDGVFHLYAISRVLKSDPLNSIVVLTNDQWRSRRNGSGSCIWVHSCAALLARMHVVLLHLRCLGMGSGRHRSPLLGLLLLRTRLKLHPWAIVHSCWVGLSLRMLHLCSSLLMRHEEGLGSE